MLPGLELLPLALSGSLTASTMAVLLMTAQLAPVVGALRVIVRVPSSPMLPKLHDRTSGLGAVLIEQLAASAPPRVQT